MQLIYPTAAEINLVISKAANNFGYYDVFNHEFTLNKDKNWDLLANIFSLVLIAKDIKSPFKPLWSTGEKTSFQIKFLTNENIIILQKILNEASDPQFIARVADVLWLNKRKLEYAEIARDNYLKCAALMVNTHNLIFANHFFERAIRLSKHIKKDDLSALQALEKVLNYNDYQNNGYLFENAFELFYEFKFGLGSSHAQMCENFAANIELQDEDKIEKWLRIIRWLNLAIKFYKRDSNKVAEIKAILKIAHSYEKRADAMTAFASIHFYKLAINEYEKLKGKHPNIEKIQHKINELNLNSENEYTTFQTEPLDLTEYANQTRANFKGMEFKEALCRLVTICQLSNPDKIREIILQELDTNGVSIIDLMPHHYINSEGRVVDISPSFHSNDPIEHEEAMLRKISSSAVRNREINFIVYISPAFSQILENNEINNEILNEIVNTSFFVPKNHESLFLKGLQFGFQEDFSTALHILVPQVENAIRQLMKKRGQVTTNIKKDGIEDEKLLSELLEMQEVKDFFGIELSYELRDLLLNKPGHNLRNDIAHGFLNEDELNFTAIPIYTWWVIFSLIIRGSDLWNDFVETNKKPNA